jgi:integrase
MSRGRGHYGAGSIDRSGENSWRVRYRINGRRYTKVVEGTKTEAQKELRRLLHAGDEGGHVAPDRITLSQWIQQWLALKERVTEGGTIERYSSILKIHVVPTLGSGPLQRITATDLDTLYARLEEKLSPRTMTLLHVTLKSCMKTAVRKGLLARNPADRAEQPASADNEVGRALDEEELTTLVRGFQGTSIYPIVAVAAYTGMRRSEILALRWIDVDLDAQAISITRSIDEGVWRPQREGSEVKARRAYDHDRRWARPTAERRERTPPSPGGWDP